MTEERKDKSKGVFGYEEEKSQQYPSKSNVNGHGSSKATKLRIVHIAAGGAADTLFDGKVGGGGRMPSHRDKPSIRDIGVRGSDESSSYGFRSELGIAPTERADFKPI